MIQDFAGVFVGRQAVRVRAIPIRDNAVGRKIIGVVLTGAVLTGIATSILFGLLIRSASNELAVQIAAKSEMVKVQNGLYARRNALLDQNTLVHAAGKLGLYAPERRQIRRL